MGKNWIALVVLSCWGGARALADDIPVKTRLVVLTDISSLKAGEAEPDDGQSLIRLMLYANHFDIEGLIATSTMGHGMTVRPELIRQVVEAYGKVQPNLTRHAAGYPEAATLLSRIRSGQPKAGLKVSVEEMVGDGKDTEGSEWIIRVVDRPEARPVWVIVWGGSADLAQALWKVSNTRSMEEFKSFLAKLRVHTISDQDATGPWIRERFPELNFIHQVRAYRGMYRAGDTNLVNSQWVRENIHGHGPLGDLYPDYRGGDIWSGKMGPVRGIKEGDTPSFLALVPNGLTDLEHPQWGSWGGRFGGEGKHLVDLADTDLDSSRDPDRRMSTVYRWRADFQNDFAARLDWCVKAPDQANHPPVARLEGPKVRQVKAGETVRLSGKGSMDPDGDRLTFDWAHYPWEKAGLIRLDKEGMAGEECTVRVGDVPPGTELVFLLTVRDEGSPPLARYARVVLKVAGK